MESANALSGERSARSGLEWDILADDGFALDAVLPVQFEGIWHRTRAIRPETALALGVLWQAVIDLRKNRSAGDRVFQDARDWVGSDDRKWPYSFLNLCDALGLPAEVLREMLLSDEFPSEAPAGCRRGVKQAA